MKVNKLKMLLKAQYFVTKSLHKSTNNYAVRKLHTDMCMCIHTLTWSILEQNLVLLVFNSVL